jgi:hypothetical protein
MTEQEWLTGVEWMDLWVYSACEIGRLTDRKKTLFAISACRHIAHRLEDPSVIRAFEVTERFADGAADATEYEQAFEAVDRASDECYFHQRSQLIQAATRAVRWMCAGDMDKISSASEFVADIYGYEAAIAEGILTLNASPAEGEAIWQNSTFISGKVVGERIQADLLRELIGNPFRHISFDPAWLAWNNRCIERIAQAIYDERAFDRMPILADALEDAGCDNADILNHCRSGGEHVRGCWVVDLLLGKQ